MPEPENKVSLRVTLDDIYKVYKRLQAYPHARIEFDRLTMLAILSHALQSIEAGSPHRPPLFPTMGNHQRCITNLQVDSQMIQVLKEPEHTAHETPLEIRRRLAIDIASHLAEEIAKRMTVRSRTNSEYNTVEFRAEVEVDIRDPVYR